MIFDQLRPRQLLYPMNRVREKEFRHVDFRAQTGTTRFQAPIFFFVLQLPGCWLKSVKATTHQVAVCILKFLSFKRHTCSHIFLTRLLICLNSTSSGNLWFLLKEKSKNLTKEDAWKVARSTRKRTNHLRWVGKTVCFEIPFPYCQQSHGGGDVALNRMTFTPVVIWT